MQNIAKSFVCEWDNVYVNLLVLIMYKYGQKLCTIFSSPELQAQGELLWAFLHLSSVNNLL